MQLVHAHTDAHACLSFCQSHGWQGLTRGDWKTGRSDLEHHRHTREGTHLKDSLRDVLRLTTLTSAAMRRTSTWRCKHACGVCGASRRHRAVAVKQATSSIINPPIHPCHPSPIHITTFATPNHPNNPPFSPFTNPSIHLCCLDSPWPPSITPTIYLCHPPTLQQPSDLPLLPFTSPPLLPTLTLATLAHSLSTALHKLRAWRASCQLAFRQFTHCRRMASIWFAADATHARRMRCRARGRAGGGGHAGRN